MTSFMQTMFVPPSPSSPSRASHFPYAARPLTPLHSNVLAASQSCLYLQWPEQAHSVYDSPSEKQCRDYLGQPAQTNLFQNSLFAWQQPASAAKSPVRGPLLGQDYHQNQHALGFGLDQIGMQADLFMQNSNNNARTRSSFKPRSAQKGTNSWQLKQFAEATLGSGSLKKVVKLPEGEDKDEWLAVNVVDFYNQINLLYGAITEFCSPHTCPEMKATDEFEYLWHHPPAFPKPTRLPAPTYISHLLTWTSTLLSDANLFPTHPGVPFPAQFQSTVKQIFKRLYRIYAHIYCHHYSIIRGLGLEAHLNTGFKHYVLFVEEFGLADEGGKKGARAEYFGPLGDLVESMLRSD